MAASSPVNGKWEELRKEARQLENSIDLKLVSFSKLGTGFNVKETGRDGPESVPLLNNTSTDHMFETMSLEIEQLLSNLTEINDAMSEYTSNSRFGELTPTQLHTLQRHRDILQDYSHEFTKTKANIKATREREDLLGSVHRDINAYKNSSGLNRRTDLYLKEHEHLRNSDRLTDEAIGVALATKENMISQRGLLYGISTRVGNVANRFPVVNSLINRINIRKRRDAIILGCVIGICLILLLLYALR